MAIENGYGERMSVWRGQLNCVGDKKSVSLYANAERIYLYCLKNGAVVKFGNQRRDITEEFLQKLKFIIELRDKDESERRVDPHAWMVINSMLRRSYRDLIQFLKHSKRHREAADRGNVPFVMSWKQLKYFNDMIVRLGFSYDREGGIRFNYGTGGDLHHAEG